MNAFTLRYQKRQNKLMTTTMVINKDINAKVNSLWDTGATATCISERLVDVLGLIPIGKVDLRTPSGIKTVNQYVVDILLPNKVKFADVVVCDSKIGDQGLDVLIGMDIISTGDLVVCNNGTTSFSFRYPPGDRIEFAEIKEG